MKILILCAGAIGSVYAGFLKKADYDVTILGRKWHLNAIKKNGLKITGIWGEHQIDNLRCFSLTEELTDEKFELIIISVKSYDTSTIAKLASKHLNKNGFVVSFQNGVDNLEKVSKFIDYKQILIGRIIFGAEIISPGVVKVSVMAEEARLGCYENYIDYTTIEKFAKLFDEAGIPTMPTREVMKYLWAKLLYNCALNALCTILDIPYGKLLGNEYTESLMKIIVQEAFEVARAKKIKLFWNKPEEYIEVLFNKLIPSTATHFPSMLQDIKNNKKTEIDALNGVIVKYASELKIPVPINDCITKIIKSIETLKVKLGDR